MAGRPRIGLTDGLYPQLRTILDALGAEPVELGQEAAAAFFAPAISASPKPEAAFRVRDFLLKGRWPARRAELAGIEAGPGAETFIKAVLEHRRAGGDPLDAYFLSAFLDLGAISGAVDGLDGLLVAGGEDLEPAWYAQENAGSGPFHRTRDLLEMAFMREALERDLPLLCLCRGSQVLNAALGGSLYQDLKALDPALGERHASAEEAIRAAGHDVRLAPSSRLASWMGCPAEVSTVNVNSYHHQGFHRLGRGLEAAAWDAEGASPVLGESLPEALLLSEKRFALGVQWHPERPRPGPRDADPLSLKTWAEIEPAWRPGDRALLESFLGACRGG